MEYEIDFNDHLEYDESLPGLLRRKIGLRKGSPAGGMRKDGYWRVSVCNNRYLSHRVIWEMLKYKLKPEDQIDHIDGNPTNNNINNLRVVTDSINKQNMQKFKSNSSGKTGVSLLKDSYGNWGYYATWHDTDKKSRLKRFSIKQHGLLPAFAKASKYRDDMIAELIAHGSHYTERHGL